MSTGAFGIGAFMTTPSDHLDVLRHALPLQLRDRVEVMAEL
jgi:hypothetical protein